jgi:hypothetical protein
MPIDGAPQHASLKLESFPSVPEYIIPARQWRCFFRPPRAGSTANSASVRKRRKMTRRLPGKGAGETIDTQKRWVVYSGKPMVTFPILLWKRLPPASGPRSAHKEI